MPPVFNAAGSSSPRGLGENRKEEELTPEEIARIAAEKKLKVERHRSRMQERQSALSMQQKKMEDKVKKNYERERKTLISEE